MTMSLMQQSSSIFGIVRASYLSNFVQGFNNSYVVNGLAVVQHAAGANASVDVEGGIYVIGGVTYIINGVTNLPLTQDANNPRYALIYTASTGATSALGMAVADPTEKIPDLPSGAIALAWVFVDSSGVRTTVLTSDITDERIVQIPNSIVIPIAPVAVSATVIKINTSTYLTNFCTNAGNNLSITKYDNNTNWPWADNSNIIWMSSGSPYTYYDGTNSYYVGINIMGLAYVAGNADTYSPAVNSNQVVYMSHYGNRTNLLFGTSLTVPTPTWGTNSGTLANDTSGDCTNSGTLRTGPNNNVTLPADPFVTFDLGSSMATKSLCAVMTCINLNGTQGATLETSPDNVTWTTHATFNSVTNQTASVCLQVQGITFRYGRIRISWTQNGTASPTWLLNQLLCWV